MKVYRLCSMREFKQIQKEKSFQNVGNKFVEDPSASTHKYDSETSYIHFFKNLLSILYLYAAKGEIICVYDIPEKILSTTKGIGKYWDFIFHSILDSVNEFAIPSNKMKFEYLKTAFLITEDLFFDYVPTPQDLNKNLKKIWSSTQKTVP